MIKLKDILFEKKKNKGNFPPFDTGLALKGNGLTIYDRNQEKSGDYRNIAHISDNGKITIYDKNIKKQPHLMKSIKDMAKSRADYMKVANEGKLTEASAYKTATRNELAMYITQLSNTINGTKDKKMLMYLKQTKKEVEKELKSRKKIKEAPTKLMDILNEKLDFGQVMDKYNKNIVDNALALAKQHAIKDKHKGSEQTPKLIAIKTINRMKEYRNKIKAPDLKKLFQKVIDKLEKDYKKIKEGKLNEEAKGYKQALQKFIKYGNKQIKAYFKKHYDKTYDRGQYSQIALLRPGKKYDRVVNVRADQPNKPDGGVHCFIDKETGIIYKPKSWSGPATNFGRASIFKPATYKKIDPHGSWLYKR